MRWGVCLSLLLVCAGCVRGNSSRDAEAYSLGQEHGREFVEEAAAGDTAGMCNRLLDVRTRETDLRHRLGDVVADSYVDGFEAYVTDKDPHTASLIFPD